MWERLFGLDAQLLFDAVVLAINIFILFVAASYFLFNPARELFRKRQEAISADRDTAKAERESAEAMKAEYEARLKNADKEVESILGEARKRALKNEENIVNEAKVEADRIMKRADVEIQRDKKKAADDIKKEIISVATAMAGKIVETSIDDKQQSKLIDETLKEIGDDTWLN
ncbi:MAG: F0F1 ATP synthase subunit B [Eubacterium sp.]